MARAVAARIQGDDYQTRFFWLQACRLFESHTKVASVGYEVSEIKAFDDVVVAYDPPVNDDRGGVVATDYFQVKFHVSQEGTVRFESLMDPEFIGATRFSFLQRLRDAHAMTKGRGGCRFTLVTPWAIDPRDLLARLINNNAGQIHLDRLFAPGPGSRMGTLRWKMAEHLDINEESLCGILASMRIQHSFGSLAFLNERLSDKLALAGMKPVELTSTSSPYDDLARKLLQAGRHVFTAAEIKEICEREGLWIGRRELIDSHADVGIRSFVRRAEYIEDETDAVLDLLPYFDGRLIRDASLWNTEVSPRVVQFLETHAKTGGAYRLRLDAHTSIAVLAGYVLDTKSGVSISLVQKTRSGVEVWDAEKPSSEPESAWEFSSIVNDDVMDGDMAVAVSITHDVREDVKVFLGRSGLPIRKTLTATLSQTANTAVQGGSHALALAQTLVAELRTHRRDSQTIHLFIAAPNGFSFVLGQHLRAVGPAIVYEFNFESGGLGAYDTGVSLPAAHIAST